MKTVIQLPNTHQNFSYPELLKRIGFLENSLERFTSQNLILTLKTLEGIIFVKISDISFIKADSNYSYIFMNDRKKMVVSKTLKYIHSQLPKNLFVRIHQSYVVNKFVIDRCLHGANKTLVLKSGEELPVSKKCFINILNISE
jgi:two-component system LytT family response regulator